MAHNQPQGPKTYWPMIEAHVAPHGFYAAWEIRVGAPPMTRVIYSEANPTTWDTYQQALSAGVDAVGHWMMAHGSEEP